MIESNNIFARLEDGLGDLKISLSCILICGLVIIYEGYKHNIFGVIVVFGIMCVTGLGSLLIIWFLRDNKPKTDGVKHE